MEGQSDKSSAMSDSGGLIDLSGVSATGSRTPSSKNGDSSLENSKEGSGAKSGGDGSRGGPTKRVHHLSAEMWLADMDAEMNGVKLIGEEEFDFDIPEEYLNISFEPVHPDSLEEKPCGTEGETTEGLTTSSLERDENCQTRDESFQLLPAMMVPVQEQNGATAETVSDQQTGNLLFPMQQCLVLGAEGCVEPCPLEDESRRKSSSTDSGVSGMSTQGFNFEEEGDKAAATGLLGTQKKHATPRDLISFTPWVVEPQENEEGGAAGTSVGASPALGSAAFQGDVPGDRGCDENQSLPQMAESSSTLEDGCRDGAEKVLSDGESGGKVAEGESTSSEQNRSRLPMPKKQLRKCSVFNSSPVKCSQLEDLKSVPKEGDSLLHRSVSETIIVTGSTAARTVGSTTMPRSSSYETFIIPDSNANEGGERVGSANLNDSTSSCKSQSSTASRESRDSTSGTGPAARKTGAIPRASSRRKLTKLSSKPSLLPSKPTSTLPKVTRRPSERSLTKPGTVANTKGSQLPNPPQGLKSPSVRRDNPAKPRVADDGKGRVASRLKPVRATGMAVRPTANTGNKLTSRLPPKGVGQRQQNSQTGPKSTFTPRRNSNPITQPTCNPLQGQPATSNISLSTSIVSTGSPSVQQSTPIKTAAKATPKRKVIPLTPKAPMDTTPEMPRATFSFSSIEGGSSCVKQPVVRVSDANDTYKVESEGAPDMTARLQTPQSSKKKRRSFIPTPGGQERAAHIKISSPILYDSNRADEGSVADTRGTSPMLTDPSLTKRNMQMPPPKARKVLNPRTRPSGLQRLRGGRPRGVFAVRQPTVGKSRQEGPLKAKRAFAYGRDADFDDSEFPIPRAKVVHSPLGQENQVTTPHSEWSPIRKKPVSLEEACIQCTKKGRH